LVAERKSVHHGGALLGFVLRGSVRDRHLQVASTASECAQDTIGRAVGDEIRDDFRTCRTQKRDQSPP
jgi:hypothetical protein